MIRATSSADTPDPAQALPARAPTAWWREPLLHFVLLGGVLFAIDHVVAERAGDPRAIVVAADVTREARTLFRNARGRDPNPDELQALTRRWLDNEILFREGLALRVDQGDDMIRERVIFKSLMVVESGLTLPAIDEAGLRAWFETQRARYDEPPRFDFDEAAVSGEADDAALQSFAQALNSGNTAPDVQAGLRVFKGRPRANIEQSYGVDFAKALESLTPGQWQVLPTRDGPRVMRLVAVQSPRPAAFEQLRNVVLADWTDATKAQMRTDAVRQRGTKYKVRFEGETP